MFRCGFWCALPLRIVSGRGGLGAGLSLSCCLSFAGVSLACLPACAALHTAPQKAYAPFSSYLQALSEHCKTKIHPSFPTTTVSTSTQLQAAAADSYTQHLLWHSTSRPARCLKRKVFCWCSSCGWRRLLQFSFWSRPLQRTVKTTLDLPFLIWSALYHNWAISRCSASILMAALQVGRWAWWYWLVGLLGHSLAWVWRLWHRASPPPGFALLGTLCCVTVCWGLPLDRLISTIVASF